MLPLHFSQNYVWSEEKVLGVGATSIVCEGWNRTNGERVAVKTFNNMTRYLPYDVQMREFEMLKKVNHENIIKLLAFEQDIQAKRRILVMELCTGGSLYTILDEPENAHGLNENEFLQVLSNLAAGMKHLRDINIIHRDLKPGNIMRFIGENGKFVYKLTDFGAARELEDDQQFMSLYGTEEYLHPDMYGKAVLRKSDKKVFDATVDLWSTGVTIYHIATGELPFRPFGGRKSKEVMYHITTQKKSGIIAGVQTVENGAILWSSKLPDFIRLSHGLQDLLTPILASLLECNHAKIITFDDFFRKVTNLLNKRSFDVFDSHSCSFIKIYIDPDEKYAKFQDIIATQTDIRASDQYILFEGKIFDVSPINEIITYPTSSCNNPFILVSKSSQFSKIIFSIPQYPVIDNENFIDKDLSDVKTAAATACYIERKIQEYCCSQNLINQTVKIISSLLKDKYIHLKEHFDNLKDEYHFLDQNLNFWCANDIAHQKMLKNFSHLENFEPHIKVLQSCIKDKNESCSTISELLKDLEISVKKYYNQTLQEFAVENISMKCHEEDNCKQFSSPIINDIKEILHHYRQTKSQKSSYHENQLHLLEKVRLRDHGIKLQQKLQKHCFTNCSEIHNEFKTWYATASNSSSDLEQLEKRIANLKDSIQAFKKSLYIAQNDYEKKLDDIILLIPEQDSVIRNTLSIVTKEPNKGNKTIKKELSENLNKISEMMSNTWEKIKDNEEILQEFSRLTALDSAFNNPEYNQPMGLIK